jgi:hypothetical protein
VNITSTIKSYVYTQYADDPDISAFFASYNALSQGNLDDINGYQLPIYLNQSGALLDWAASSIYGIFRPSLSSGSPRPIGPYDTFAFNTEDFDGFRLINSSTNFIADDLTYQRIIQWTTFKGDGYHFTIRWLKNRVERFLRGAIFPDQTYEVSVAFTTDTDILISVSETNQVLTGGPFYNAQNFNGLGAAFNQVKTQGSTHAPTALASALKAAVNSGILTLPFQYTFTVQI